MASKSPEPPDEKGSEERINLEETSFPEDLDASALLGGVPFIDEEKVRELVDDAEKAPDEPPPLDLTQHPDAEGVPPSVPGRDAELPVFSSFQESVTESRVSDTDSSFTPGDQVVIATPPEHLYESESGEHAPKIHEGVVEMPTGRWDNRDAADLVNGTAADRESELSDWSSDFKTALEEEEFELLPTWLDWVIGTDKNGKRVMFGIRPVYSFQESLSGMRATVGAFSTKLKSWGLGGGTVAAADAADEEEDYLLVPIYNEAAGIPISPESVACCVPKYTRLKFTASPEGSLVTWTNLPWMGDRYSGLDYAKTTYLEVFYDKCGRGWTGIIEPHNTESILDTGYTASNNTSMIDLEVSGGMYVYTGGGPMMADDLTNDSLVSLILGNDVHPCDADLPNLNNHIFDGSDVSALVNISDTMHIYTP